MIRPRSIRSRADEFARRHPVDRAFDGNQSCSNTRCAIGTTRTPSSARSPGVTTRRLPPLDSRRE